MLEIRTTNGAGRGVIEKTFTSKDETGRRYEAARCLIDYIDGRRLYIFDDGEQLKNAIAHGELRIYGRILAAD